MRVRIVRSGTSSSGASGTATRAASGCGCGLSTGADAILPLLALAPWLVRRRRQRLRSASPTLARLLAVALCSSAVALACSSPPPAAGSTDGGGGTAAGSTDAGGGTGTGSTDGGAAPPGDGDGGGSSLPTGELRSAMATYFDGIGSPTGGCGVPSALLDSDDYVALNVEYTPYPQPYTVDSRPISNPEILGEFDNGRNCGRWLVATIGEFCEGGGNGGANGQDFCVNGQWVPDELSGAQLDMVVTDSCQDTNGWCRDDRYHLDLHRASLQRFTKDGTPVGSALANKWNNRRITWRYTEAPSYAGDVKIHFVKDAQQYWAAVVITHLENGIHGVERRFGDTWKSMPMLADNGQVYLLTSDPFQDGEGPPYVIRIRDAADQLIHGGRTYSFGLPCDGSCQGYTPAEYTTSP